jgi:hypothetical protein
LALCPIPERQLEKALLLNQENPNQIPLKSFPVKLST